MSNEPSRAYITKKILQRRYGRLLKWSKPVVHNFRGPFHPDVFDAFSFDLALSIQVCRETLQDLTDEEFFGRFDLRGEVSNEAHIMSERLALAELRAVFRQEPVWFAGGFGVEGREADVQHWARMQQWSLDETVALFIGFEPCGDLLQGVDGMPVQNDVLAYYFKRRALIADNFDWGSEAMPSKNGLGKKSRLGQSSGAHDRPLDPRERSTMLKMIIALAIKGYGYQPKAERSTTPTEIESDMHTL